MTRTGKIVVWLCSLSPLLMGCYSSTVITMTGEEEGKEKIKSKNIEYVIAKDGMKYFFHEPPKIVNDTLVGEIKTKVAPDVADDPTAWTTVPKGTHVSFPLSGLTHVEVRETNVAGTIVIVVLATCLVGAMIFGYTGGAGFGP